MVDLADGPALLISGEKITASHRARDAYVYVRQSTLLQVQVHTESLARQYDLRQRAAALGWPAHQVVVIDEDLGRSGASAAGRSGFSELVADVGLGKAGIILALEVSRLARSNADWYQLLDLCALTDTLIADADGIYQPGSYNDRLVLGLKGTMSEAELHLIRSRLTEGLRHKAARGELRQNLPVGLDYDPGGTVIITPDEAVREAIATVYRRFAELGSARAGAAVAARGRAAAAAARQRIRVRADHLGAGQLPGGARFPDQPGLCRGVRVRPHPHRKTGRRLRQAGHQRPAAAPRAVGGADPRSSSRLHHLGSLRGQHRAAAGELAAAARAGRRRRRGKALRCCRACCAAAGAGGSCRPATPGRRATAPATCAPAPSSCMPPSAAAASPSAAASWRRPSWPSCSRCSSPPRWRPPPRRWPRPTTSTGSGPGRLRAGRRARPLRRRAGPPPVRRGRAGEPAGRPHPGTRMGRQARRRPAGRERPARPAGPPPGHAHQRRARLDHHGRRRHQGGVPRADHHHPRTQAADPRRHHRGRRSPSTTSSASQACGSSGRAGPSPKLSMPMTKKGGHTRTTSEDTVDLVRRLAGTTTTRPSRDPGQAAPAHRHRPDLDQGPGRQPARPAGNPRLRTAAGKCQHRQRR